MKNIVSFSKFNESINSLKGYRSLSKKYDKVSIEELEDRLIEVTDLGVEIDRINKQFVNDKGVDIQNFFQPSTSNPNQKYFFSYSISLRYSVNKENQLSISEFGKITNKLSLVISTIESVTKNISRIYNLNILNSGVTIFSDRTVYLFGINLVSNQIPDSEIKELVGEYENTLYGKCKRVLGEISRYVTEITGISDPPLDFNWDEIDSYKGGEDYISCGFFLDEEVIVIAHYMPETNKIVYFEDEMKRAADSYEG